MAKLAALALAVGGFHNLSTEAAALRAAPGSLAFALVRDSNPTSWLQLELALGSQHLPCEGSDGHRNRPGQRQLPRSEIWKKRVSRKNQVQGQEA